MKFSLLASIVLGATARTATALEATCCYADVSVGCPSNYEDATASTSIGSNPVIINFEGVNALNCCLPNVGQVSTGQFCAGTVAPTTSTGTGTGTPGVPDIPDIPAIPPVETTTSSEGSMIGGGSSFFGETTTCDELQAQAQFLDCNCITKCNDEDAQCNDFGAGGSCVPPNCLNANACERSSSSFTLHDETHIEMNSTSTSTTTTTTTTPNPMGSPSGAMITSSASAIIVGASVTIIALFVFV
ncbi:hypothetical protein QTG54_010060 [Skeletonema marinoi]|uniref:Uncharacterized protein n=1 Tax=Skeletonema marinoi TaxID=267567 RepID=A0AAD8Y4W3_9STRA|nr:hypothetical protein QTG54_010060 [Skeletonema marinoi]